VYPRLMHGSVKHKLAWSQPIDSVPFDPVLVQLAEVCQLTVHNLITITNQRPVYEPNTGHALPLSDSNPGQVLCITQLALCLTVAISDAGIDDSICTHLISLDWIGCGQLLTSLPSHYLLLN